jgi:outer membrane protein OmpA-like peptidoglycan-associated protein
MVTISPFAQRDFTPISGKLFLADNNEVQSGYFKVQLVDINSKKVLATTEPKAVSGEFNFEAKPGSYAIITNGDGYQTDTISISIPANYSQSQYPVAVTLTRLGVSSGQFVSIRSIQFDFDKYELNNDAMFEAERIFNFLSKYPDITVEISGHTDTKGTALYNRTLSQKRAETVIAYLVSKGVNASRLQARAAGAFENIAENINPDGSDNPDGRKFNRRACISITNSTSKVQIEDELRVPEYLKPRIQKYSILLEPIGKVPSNDLLENLKKLHSESIREADCKDGGKAFLMGLFDHKSEAIVLLNSCIDNGFQSASLIGIDDLSNILLNGQLNTAGSPNSDENTIYTIQLAVVKAKNNSITSEFKTGVVTEYKEKDGRYRYLYGSFKGLNAAEVELEKVKQLGYSDAFIVNAKRFEVKK